MTVDWSLGSRRSSWRSDCVAGVGGAILGGVDGIPTIRLVYALGVTWKPGVCGGRVPWFRLVPGIGVGRVSVIRVFGPVMCWLPRVGLVPRRRVGRTLRWMLGVMCRGVGVGAAVWGEGHDGRRLHSCHFISLKTRCMMGVKTGRLMLRGRERSKATLTSSLGKGM